MSQKCPVNIGPAMRLWSFT